MGRALEPGLKLELWLDWDASKPRDKRPVFFTKALSMREQTALADKYDKILESTGDDAMTMPRLDASIVELLEQFITGWENQNDRDSGEPIPFTPDAFADVLDRHEAFELVRKAMAGASMTTEEKKS